MSQPVDLKDISQVIEIDAFYNNRGLEKVNLYLGSGWVLLATHVNGDTVVGQNQVYSLGWPRTLGEATHPELPDKWASYLSEKETLTAPTND